MLLFPRGHSRFSQRPTASCPSPARASLCPSNHFCSPRPEGRPTRPLLQPPAPAVRSCETRCLLASRCPAKYRHQVRPDELNLAAGGGGRRPLPPPETPPAPLAAVAEAGRGVPGPKPGGGAHAATPLRSGPGYAKGRGGGVRASGPGCSGRCLRLSAAGSAAVPAAAAINLRGRGRTGAGPGQSGYALSSARKSGGRLNSAVKREK